MIDNDIAKAIQELKKGNIIGIPTETVYGLAVNALNSNAIKKLYKVKQRLLIKPTSLQLGHKKDISKYFDIRHPREQKIIDKLMPGSITLILYKKNSLPKVLFDSGPTCGIRIPQDPIALNLLQHIDFPLAVPSANRQDDPAATNHHQAQEVFADEVAYYLSSEQTSSQQASTLVQIQNNEIHILRPGPITLQHIQQAIKQDNNVTIGH